MRRAAFNGYEYDGHIYMMGGVDDVGCGGEEEMGGWMVG
jgi:hypothetical protein